jgi:hypothetical protein
MMERSRLQNRIYWGLNVAARQIGRDTDAYRPNGPEDPLSPANRYLRLRAAFSAPDGKFLRPNGYGVPVWYGAFDGAYTRPGDFLVQDADIWFIAAQQKLLPMLCVQTNRIVNFVRPSVPSMTGLNSYGGVSLETSTKLIRNYPASILGASGAGQPSANLPTDTSVGTWTVLLPAPLGPNGTPVILQPADIMTDDLGRNAVISGAELTDLGWRLTVKQATT